MRVDENRLRPRSPNAFRKLAEIGRTPVSVKASNKADGRLKARPSCRAAVPVSRMPLTVKIAP